MESVEQRYQTCSGKMPKGGCVKTVEESVEITHIKEKCRVNNILTLQFTLHFIRNGVEMMKGSSKKVILNDTRCAYCGREIREGERFMEEVAAETKRFKWVNRICGDCSERDMPGRLKRLRKERGLSGRFVTLGELMELSDLEEEIIKGDKEVGKC